MSLSPTTNLNATALPSGSAEVAANSEVSPTLQLVSPVTWGALGAPFLLPGHAQFCSQPTIVATANTAINLASIPCESARLWVPSRLIVPYGEIPTRLLPRLQVADMQI